MISAGARRSGQKMSKQQGKYELLKEDTSLRLVFIIPEWLSKLAFLFCPQVKAN